MSSKLDKSLDEIAGARRNTRRARPRKAAPVAGGITKATAGRTKASKPAAPAAKATATLLPRGGESKIAVGNLPEDVTDDQIKEYFATTVGPVKRVIMNYKQNGRSAGSGTIIFRDSNAAAEAAKAYNGVLVDKRPMRIEVIVNAQQVAQPPPPKGLKDRIVNGPKKATAKPNKASTNGKAAAANATTGGTGARRGGRKGPGGRQSRPKKTAEQLDADMADYFDPNAANGTAAAAPAAAATNGGETAMVEDEIM